MTRRAGEDTLAAWQTKPREPSLAAVSLDQGEAPVLEGTAAIHMTCGCNVLKNKSELLQTLDCPHTLLHNNLAYADIGIACPKMTFESKSRAAKYRPAPVAMPAATQVLLC